MASDINPYILVIGSLSVALGAAFAIKKLFFSKKENYPRDTVIIRHTFGGWKAPSFSPYPLKIETYLRIAKLRYKNVYNSPLSSKWKTPWMQYNDEIVADSQLCLKFIDEKLNVDLNASLTTAERATSRAFQRLIDEHLYWCLVLIRWVHGSNQARVDFVRRMKMPCAPLVAYYLKWMITRQASGQGMGRHSVPEVTAIMADDLKAISDFLGNKKYLMGNTVTEVDCSLFGMLSQFKWHLPNSTGETMVTETFPNLNAYCDRMVADFWPDWEEAVAASRKK